MNKSGNPIWIQEQCLPELCIPVTKKHCKRYGGVVASDGFCLLGSEKNLITVNKQAFVYNSCTVSGYLLIWIVIHNISPDVLKCRCAPLAELPAQTEETGVGWTEMWEWQASDVRLPPTWWIHMCTGVQSPPFSIREKSETITCTPVILINENLYNSKESSKVSVDCVQRENNSVLPEWQPN